MTGPQHYRDAERLLRLAGSEPEQSMLTPVLLAAAQVHAALAVAGVQADRLADPYTSSRADLDAWAAATGAHVRPVRA